MGNNPRRKKGYMEQFRQAMQKASDISRDLGVPYYVVFFEGEWILTSKRPHYKCNFVKVVYNKGRL